MHEIIKSINIELLLERFAEDIKNSDKGVFGRQIIVTPTGGMNAWLKTELARKNEVLANVEFLNPEGLFRKIYRIYNDTPLENNLNYIRYTLYETLNSEEFMLQFPKVSEYYKGIPLKRHSLAGKIADLFDQYQIYRPNIISGWERCELNTGKDDEAWQCWLWRKMNVRTKETVKKELLLQIKSDTDKLKAAFCSVYFFGISIYTEFHLDFFKDISNYISVKHYIKIPFFKLNIEQPDSNILLESMGKKFWEQEAQFPDGVQLKEHTETETNDLKRLQTAIQENNAGSVNFSQDDSLHVNACYTPAREVECLYNYLLNSFDKNRALKPSDVLVVASDINKYSPFIKAVFRNAPVNIPIQVSGEITNSGDNITSVLEQILSMTIDDLTSEKVVRLAEFGRIKNKYKINDISRIRSVLKDANIRFSPKIVPENSDLKYISWEYGFRKLALGYAMLLDEEIEYDGMYPYRDSESAYSYDLFRLNMLYDDLKLAFNEMLCEKTLPEWKKFIFEIVIERMIFHSDFSKEDRAEINEIYRSLSFIDILPDSLAPVPYEVFLSELKTNLFTRDAEYKLNTGRVTISAPVPVRSIPYKIICFIGLNNGVFPRIDHHPGFDLLGEDYQAGDRSVKETDKSLFLEILLSAREKLYFSYLGVSVKDNKKIPCSIVLDNLLSYMKKEAVEHPLHGFSTRYGDSSNSDLYTYLYAEKSTDFGNREFTSDISELSSNKFIEFFQDPLKWYFRNVQHIYDYESDDTLPEEELFEMNNLEKWLVKNEIMKTLGNHSDEMKKNFKQKGLLPLDNLGNATFKDFSDQVNEIKDRMKELVGDCKCTPTEVNIQLENIKILGTIENVYDGKYIYYAFSKDLDKKHLVSANLNMLMLCATGKIEENGFFLLPGNKDSELIPVNKEIAIEKLKKLEKYILKGIANPMPYTLRTANKSNDISEPAELFDLFYNEAFPAPWEDRSPNKYLVKLFDEDYFDDLKSEDLEDVQTMLNLTVSI